MVSKTIDKAINAIDETKYYDYNGEKVYIYREDRSTGEVQLGFARFVKKEWVDREKFLNIARPWKGK